MEILDASYKGTHEISITFNLGYLGVETRRGYMSSKSLKGRPAARGPNHDEHRETPKKIYPTPVKQEK